MEAGQGVRFWCHNCEEVIDPVLPEMKCPDCDSGFVEEMDPDDPEPAPNLRSDGSLLLWAPLLLGMMRSSSRRSRLRRAMMDDDEEEEEEEEAEAEEQEDDDGDSDHELEDLLRRRRRGSSLVRLLQTLRDDLRSLDDIGRDGDMDRERERLRRERRRERERERERERQRERDRGRERTESLILINSNNEAIILQGTFGPDDNQEDSGNTSSGVSLGDYFLGPGLDLLLQRLAESDMNRSGTPPAKKEAVEALPTVNIQEVLGCSVCLEDFEMGTEAKEMPCQHKFHSQCIFPWLELHSSCPICRFQLPAEESKNPCESANGVGTINNDDNSAASSSDVESTNHVGGNHPGSPIFSALTALFASPSSSSSSDENMPHPSEN